MLFLSYVTMGGSSLHYFIPYIVDFYNQIKKQFWQTQNGKGH